MTNPVTDATVSRAEAIRILSRRGWSRARIARELVCSAAAVASALKHTKPVGRPPVPRCEHCGQPIPAARANATQVSG